MAAHPLPLLLLAAAAAAAGAAAQDPLACDAPDDDGGARCLSAELLEAWGVRPAARPSSAVVRLEVNNWDGARVSAEAARVVLRDAMGYDVRLRHCGSSAGTLRRLADASSGIDANMELWATSHTGFIEELLAAGGTSGVLSAEGEVKAAAEGGRPVRDAGALGFQGRSGWYIGGGADDDAELSRLFLDFWRAYQADEDGNADERLFAYLPEYPTVPAERYFEGNEPFVPPLCQREGARCVEFWADRPSYARWGLIHQTIMNLELPIVMVFLGTDGTRDTVNERLAAGLAALFYHWSPTPMVAQGNFTRVALPPYTAACGAAAREANLDPETALQGAGGVACDFVQVQVFKAARASLRRDPYMVDAAVAIEALSLGENGQLEILSDMVSPPPADLELRRLDAARAACEWVRGQEELVKAVAHNSGVEVAELSTGLAASIYVVVSLALAATLAVGFAVHKHRKVPVIAASSVPFMLLTVGGLALQVAGLFAVPVVNDANCSIVRWFFSVGFMLSTASLIGKAWRANRLFLSRNLTSGALSDAYVIRRVLALVGLSVLLLVIEEATLTDRIDTEVTLPAALLTNDPVVVEERCAAARGPASVVNYSLIACMLAFGVAVAFASRSLPRGFSDAKTIGLTLYNYALTFIIGVGILLSSNSFQVAASVRVFAVVYATLFTLAAVFGTRLYYVNKPLPPGFFDRVLTGNTNLTAGGSAPGRKSGGDKSSNRSGSHQQQQHQAGSSFGGHGRGSLAPSTLVPGTPRSGLGAVVAQLEASGAMPSASGHLSSDDDMTPECSEDRTYGRARSIPAALTPRSRSPRVDRSRTVPNSSSRPSPLHLHPGHAAVPPAAVSPVAEVTSEAASGSGSGSGGNDQDDDSVEVMPASDSGEVLVAITVTRPAAGADADADADSDEKEAADDDGAAGGAASAAAGGPAATADPGSRPRGQTVQEMAAIRSRLRQ